MSARGTGRGSGARLALSVLFLLVGTVMAVGPVLSHVYLSWHASRQATTMVSEAAAVDPGLRDELLLQAHAYNAAVRHDSSSYAGVEVAPYAEQLDMAGDGSMSVLEVPKAGIKMVVYHGVADTVLSQGVGHVEDTTLPVGDVGDVLVAGHSGMGQLRVFDGIRCLDEGDRFMLTTLGETMCYEVDGWEIVDPGRWRYDPGEEDAVTLVTCTTEPDPLNPKGAVGINDRRLLVHGVRCEYVPEEMETVRKDPSVYLNDNTAAAWLVAAMLIAAGGVSTAAAIRRRKRAGRDGPI